MGGTTLLWLPLISWVGKPTKRACLVPRLDGGPGRPQQAYLSHPHIKGILGPLSDVSATGTRPSDLNRSVVAAPMSHESYYGISPCLIGPGACAHTAHTHPAPTHPCTHTLTQPTPPHSLTPPPHTHTYPHTLVSPFTHTPHTPILTCTLTQMHKIHMLTYTLTHTHSCHTPTYLLIYTITH